MDTITITDTRQQAIQTVLDGLTSVHSKRAYQRALNDFVTWHTAQGQPPLTKAVITSYKAALQAQGRSAATINQTLAAIRRLVREAADNGAVDPVHAQAIACVKGVKSQTLPAGRSITAGELSALLSCCANDKTPAGARDAALIALLYSCGLRRSEAVNFDLADYDASTGELRIIGGKGGKDRLAYVTGGAALALADWLSIRGDAPGALFYPIRRGGHVQQGQRLTTQAVYVILQDRAAAAGVSKLSPHDFRRSFVGDLLDAGADIATVQRLAGHADPATTSRYDRRSEATKRRAVEMLHVPYFAN